MLKIAILAVAFMVVALIASAGSRRRETFKTLDSVVEDTRERFKRGEFDD